LDNSQTPEGCSESLRGAIADAEQSERLLAAWAELDAQRAELEAERRAFRAEQQQWTEAHRVMAEPQSAPADAGPERQAARQDHLAAPIDAVEALRRLAASDLGFRRTGPQDEMARTEPGTAPCQDGEEELSDYVGRFMARLQGTATGAQASRSQPPLAAPRVAPPPTRPAEPGSAQRLALSGAANISPRSAAPETRAGLEAMRELAQASTRHAVRRHSGRQTLRVMGNKLLVTVIALLAAAALFWLQGSPGSKAAAAYAALASLMVAVLWGTQSALAARQLIANKLDPREGKPPCQPPSEQPAPDQAAGGEAE